MDAIRATIDAAYIQGFLGLFGALLGAIVLICSIKITAKNTLEAHKVEKLAEAKRDIYLDVVKSWYNFLLVFNTYQNIKDKVDIKEQLSDFSENFRIAFKDLTTALHQSSFVSEPLTKEKVLDFTMKLTEDYFYLNLQVARYYLNINERDEISFHLMDFMNDYGLKCLELQKDLRVEIGITEDENVNVRILNKQKDFAAKVKSKIMKIRSGEFQL